MGTGLVGRRCAAGLLMIALLWGSVSAMASVQQTPFYFGVLNQRSISLTAQYWNPILHYVSEKSGVPLRLKMGKSAAETTAMTVRGEFAFVYTNHLFTPERARLGFRVIARPDAPAIRSQIILKEHSSIQLLQQLRGRRVVFPSHEAFVGYWLPTDALLKEGIHVLSSFAGNQEGAIVQLRSGAVEAAAVNAQVLESYARRENFHYRVLWESEPYLGLPVMANPLLPETKVAAVRSALVGMMADPEGRKILEQGARLLKLKTPQGFVSASDADYENYRRFYQNTVVKND